MSDREGGEDDVGLPKATVYKLIAGESLSQQTWAFIPRLSHRMGTLSPCASSDLQRS
jgi:hypothetical protein